ncbi:hypothetical protein PVAND_009266 [Polypedilum vanderplanki]|uniref:Kinesin-like protein n=1 Tax=Polypedilum vanderplanki TaxID=319348 RepID=A0A9J6CCL1_POLVA|nr:hypothetical protein PVAND_009266 [Polypedilum vanderplanki]
MDSKIPKPSASMSVPKKIVPSSTQFFDFKSARNLNQSEKTATEMEKKKALTEKNQLSNFGQFKFIRSKSPDPNVGRSKPVASKLRRSKSHADLNNLLKVSHTTTFKAGMKRTNAGIENIPAKRLKTTSIAKPTQLNIKTQEKKNAIISTIKSTSLVATTNAIKKPTLAKSNSDGPAAVAAATSKQIQTKTVTNKKPATATTTTTAAKPKAKIPPYDFKARFLDLKERYDVIKAKNEEQKEQIATLEVEADKFETRERELLDKIEKLEFELFEATDSREKIENELMEMKKTNKSLTIKNNALAADLTMKSDELKDTKQKFSDLTNKHEKQTIEYEDLKKVSGTLKIDFEEASIKLNSAQEQLYQINIERKVLHNMVLDLRGNIRVFARVRPPLQSEEDRMLCGWSFNDETSLEIHNNELVPSTGTRKQTKHDFSFDQVFDPNTTQEEIFEMVSPLIQSALDGYNICIFAYGQTGSGKTFTMDGADQKLGIIPRTVKLLFDSMKTAEVLGWKYTIKASFLEIYNEVLYDLLSNENKNVEIRMANANNKTEIYVSNLTEIEVSTAARLHELMIVARSNRATASTAGNERSSRSHAVTRLEITGKHANRPEILVGMINLVDLAGSESPKTSTRMDETKNINRSLSELSNVILALVQKNEHVPYRNSKLTHLLMPSLGGNSKTLMFVNVSPFQDCFVESVKSLRFAATVNSCKLAKAKRNRQLNQSSII